MIKLNRFWGILIPVYKNQLGTKPRKKKGKDMTQAYDKRPNFRRKIQKAT